MYTVYTEYTVHTEYTLHTIASITTKPGYQDPALSFTPLYIGVRNHGRDSIPNISCSICTRLLEAKSCPWFPASIPPPTPCPVPSWWLPAWRPEGIFITDSLNYNLWQLLTVSDSYWQYLADTNSIWMLLTVSECYWQYLKVVGCGSGGSL